MVNSTVNKLKGFQTYFSSRAYQNPYYIIFFALLLPENNTGFVNLVIVSVWFN